MTSPKFAVDWSRRHQGGASSPRDDAVAVRRRDMRDPPGLSAFLTTVPSCVASPEDFLLLVVRGKSVVLSAGTFVWLTPLGAWASPSWNRPQR